MSLRGAIHHMSAISFHSREPPIGTNIGSIHSQYAQHGTAECPTVDNGCYSGTWGGWLSEYNSVAWRYPAASQNERFADIYYSYIQPKNEKTPRSAGLWPIVAEVTEDIRPMCQSYCTNILRWAMVALGLWMPLRKWTSTYTALMDDVQYAILCAYSLYSGAYFYVIAD